MMEVIARFQAIGTIDAYMALPEEKRVLYDQFTITKIIEESKASPLNAVKAVMGGLGKKK